MNMHVIVGLCAAVLGIYSLFKYTFTDDDKYKKYFGICLSVCAVIVFVSEILKISFR